MSADPVDPQQLELFITPPPMQQPSAEGDDHAPAAGAGAASPSADGASSPAAAAASPLVTPLSLPSHPTLHVHTDSSGTLPIVTPVPVNDDATPSPPAPSAPSPRNNGSAAGRALGVPGASAGLSLNHRTPSPSPSPPPASPPLFLDAFRGCPRIADYFLVLGRINDADTPLVPMRKLSRSNSQTIQPISDVVAILSAAPKDVPHDFTRIQDFSGRDVDCNPGLLRTPCFLAESRLPRRRGSQVVTPITAIDVVQLDKKETPKPGFTLLAGNIAKGSLGRNVAIAVERDPHKSPLIEIKIVVVPGGVKALADAAKWAQSQGASAPAVGPLPIPASLSNPFAPLIPNEYTRVDRPLNVSKEMFLVYKVAKRRAVEYMSYEPFLVDRYPERDHPDFKLETQGVSMLCFPRGMLLRPENQLPNFMTFVLTQASGAEVYGAALIFYELMPQDPQNLPGQAAQQGEAAAAAGGGGGPGSPGSTTFPAAYCPRCLCLLSHYPFYEVFKTFLNQLYRIAVSPSNNLPPIERFIGHFFNEVPVPRSYIPNVHYSIGHAKVLMSLPPPCGLPYKNFSLLTLFRVLSVANVVALWEHVMSEGKVVFYSNSHTTLTPVAEGIRLLLFPLKWQCVFIPILPTNLAYTVRAPVPFIIGLHRSFLDELKVPEDVFLVDLDRNRIRWPNNLAPRVGVASSSSPEGDHGDGAHAASPSHHSTGGGGSATSPDYYSSPSSHSNGPGQSNGGGGGGYSDDTKLLHPLPESLREFLTAELLDVTTSPLDGATLLYQEQDLSEEDVSLFQPSMVRDDFAQLDPAQLEQQELRIRLAFLKVQTRIIGGYRRFILLRKEESESFFDLDRLFDRAAFAKSFQPQFGGDESLYRFARQLADTQIFSTFVLQRVVNTPQFQELFYFDYCVALAQEDPATGQPSLTLTAGTYDGGMGAGVGMLAPSSAAAILAGSGGGLGGGGSNGSGIAQPLITPTAAQLRLQQAAKHGGSLLNLSNSGGGGGGGDQPPPAAKESSKLEQLARALRRRVAAPSPAQAHSLALMAELLRPSSLSAGMLDAIRYIPPSLVPMPEGWTSLAYVVPPPELCGSPSSATGAGDGPQGRGRGASALARGGGGDDTFPSLDPSLFGPYSAAGAVAEVARALEQLDPPSPNSPLKWLMNPHPSHTAAPGTGAAGALAAAAAAGMAGPDSSPSPSPSKPSHTRGSVGARRSPSNTVSGGGRNRRGTQLEALDLAVAANEHARDKILVSLYAHINSLLERIKLWPGNDRQALPHVSVIYEVWFALFVSQCEKERVRKRALRRRRIAEGTYWPVSLLSPQQQQQRRESMHMQLGPGDTGSGRPSLSAPGISPSPDSHLSESSLRAEEHRESLADLLLLFIELHSMVSKGGVPPTERILEDVSLFALRMGLTKEFQEIYRLFSTSVPHLSTRFFSQMVRVGVTTPIVHPAAAARAAEGRGAAAMAAAAAAASGDEAAASAAATRAAVQERMLQLLPPGEPDDPLNLFKRAKASSVSGAGAGAGLSTFDCPHPSPSPTSAGGRGSSASFAALQEDDAPPSYSYPLSVCSEAECPRCNYALSGEEILAGWLLHPDRLCTCCPLCEADTTPYLVVRMPDTPHKETRVEYVKPSAIRATLRSLALLRRAPASAAAPSPSPSPSSSPSGGRSGQGFGGASGVDAHTSARAEVGRSEYLDAIRASPMLFWNVFWIFSLRGSRSRGGFGQLPFHFLFASEDSEDSVLSRVQQSYVSECGPYRPWIVRADVVAGSSTRSSGGSGGQGHGGSSGSGAGGSGTPGEGSSGQSSVQGSPFHSPFGSSNNALVSRDRAISWEVSDMVPPNHAATTTTATTAPASVPSPAENGNGSFSPTSVAALASQPRRGSILKRASGGGLGNIGVGAGGGGTANSSSNGSNGSGGTPSDKHRAPQVSALLSTLLEPVGTVDAGPRVKWAEDDESSKSAVGGAAGGTGGSRRSSGGVGFKLEPPGWMESREATPSPDPAHDSTATASASARHQRRSSLSAHNVRYIMSNVKSRPVQQAVRTILRARHERRAWSAQERNEDEHFFAASMYQQIAQLLPEGTDPLAFCTEYKAALASIDTSIEQHKKTIETLDVHLLHGSAGSNGSGAAGAGAGATVPHHGSVSASSAAAAAAAAAAASSSSSLAPLASSSGVPALKTEDAAVLEAKLRKKASTVQALDECIQMKNEVRPCDAAPTAGSLQLIMTVRRLFGCELHKSNARTQAHSRGVSFAATEGAAAAAAAAASKEVDGHVKAHLSLPSGSSASAILDEILANDVPSLEDVLTQVQQNPLFTLQGLIDFCARFRTAHELATAGAAAPQGNREVGVALQSFATPNAAASKAAAGSGSSGVVDSTALSYVMFWGAVRRWRVRYERNDRNRSLSLITKGPSGELYDSVYESAKHIWDKFLATQQDVDAAAAAAALQQQQASSASASADAAAASAPAVVPTHERRRSTLGPIAERPESSPTSSGSGGSAGATVAAGSATSLAAPVPTAHFASATPMSSSSHVTTLRGLTLPRPLHEAIRRALFEKAAPPPPSASVPAADDDDSDALAPALAHMAASRHSVPKDLYNDVATVVLNWLKRYPFPAWVDEVRRVEAQAQREELEVMEMQRKETEERDRDTHASIATATLPVPATTTAAATSPVPRTPPPVPPRPHYAHRSEGSVSALPGASASAASSPHAPPSLSQSSHLHLNTSAAFTSSTTVSPRLSGSASASASASPASGPASASGSLDALSPASPLAVNFVDTESGDVESIVKSARGQGHNHSGSSSSTTAGASPSSSSPSAFAGAGASASASSSPAPLPLLHNMTAVSLTLAKSGAHVPDYSSASPTHQSAAARTATHSDDA